MAQHPIRTTLFSLICLLFLLAPGASHAVNITLGLGFDRAHDGHGFDLHKVGDTYILYFYTYDAQGRPEWYLGTADSTDGVLSGTLSRFTYDAAANPPASVDATGGGSFVLNFNSAAAAPACKDSVDRSSAQQLSTFQWTLDGESATWCTELLAFGAQAAVNPYHGGVWYAGDADPGYGFTMSHMDHTVVAIFYYYDALGDARWALGSATDSDSTVSLLHFDGYCRTCSPQATVSSTAGTLQLAWDSQATPGSGTDQASVDLNYPLAPFGNFQRDFTLHRLSDGASSASFSTLVSQTTQDFYDTYISGPIVQSRCIVCHVQGGLSGNTRLVFSTSDVPVFQAINAQVFADFVATVADGDQLILSKITGGNSHGGGVQVQQGTNEYNNLASFLQMLVNDQASGSSAANLLLGVTTLSAERTLRKAALLFAGRLPTEAETAAVNNGDTTDLNATLRGLMQGDAFHAFLLRGANDRLLTDKFLRERIIDPFTPYFPDYSAVAHDLLSQTTDGMGDNKAYRDFQLGINQGVARAPTELIAHVVENDLPYTEILTANYIMVNPYTNIAYRSGLSFNDPTDAYEFHPGTIQGYERIGPNAQFNCQPKTGCEPLIGGLPTVYPHAGLLNTLAYLARKPSTATNRNRARARWTYYFFLDVDIEKLASRPIDADALADTDNPTMNNPNCTVCHQVHDPVAGTYQDYGDEGFYKDQYLGMDSLPRSYKKPEDGADTAYQPGDTWYADMRVPAFEGTLAPAGEDSMQWLAKQIVADPRFATATVKFWWPAVFGADPLEAPENPTDADFPVQQAAFDAQETFVAQLSNGLRNGFNGGTPFDLKDLLVAMVGSDWYQANSADKLGAEQKTELDLATVGSEHLLTPEQLNSKLQATTGYRWSVFVGGRFNRSFDLLTDVYNLYYGGIDSDGVEQRARALTPLMTKVVTTMGIESACPIVAGEFNAADEQRLLFKGLTRYLTPQTDAVSSYSVSSQQTLSLNATASGGGEKISIASDNGISGNAGVLVGAISVTDAKGTQLESFDPAQLANIPGANASCGSAQTDGWRLDNNCILEIPLQVAAAQPLTLRVAASPLNSDHAVLAISLDRDDEQPMDTTGAVAIRAALSGLHQRLLDESVALSDPELAASYQLFLDLWNARRSAHKPSYLANACNYTFSDAQKQASDPYQVMNAWMGVMTYFLTDYRFIHE